MEESEYIKWWNLWCDRYDPERIELKEILSVMSLSGNRVLEIGCGNGRLTRQLAPHCKEIVGIDNDPIMIKAAEGLEKPSNISYRLMDVLNLDFPPESFDVVIFSWTLVCLYKKEKEALEFVKNALKANGELLLVEPGSSSDYGKVVAEFLEKPQEHTTNISESYEDPIKAVFGVDPVKFGPFLVPYVFSSLDEAVDIFEFALLQWHKEKSVDKTRLRSVLSRFDKLYEAVLIYYIHLGR